MAKFNWSVITKEDVKKAIELFEQDNPSYPQPRSTFLIYNGKKYPAKHIRGMAYKVHNGIDISKNDYSGGEETARFFENLGFDIQYTHKNIDTHTSKNIKQPSQNQKVVLKAQNDFSDIKTQNIYVDDNKMNDDSGQITIPTKEVIEQKNALQLILNKLFDGDIVCEKTYSWMKTPTEISGEYKQLVSSLSEYRGNTSFAKKNVKLRCDFVCESRKIIVEYDERQHFSEARKISLLAYKNIPLNYDRDLWIKACKDIQAKDNQPIDRDEIRAYYDSTRDIEAAKHGYKLIRIMHGQIDFNSNNAKEELEKLIELEDNCIIQKHKTLNNMISNVIPSIKIGLYLQTDELYGDKNAFDNTMSLVKNSDIDILVFPEFSYFPFEDVYRNADFFYQPDIDHIYEKTLEFSKNIGKAIVLNSIDKYGTIMSVYANAFASENETVCKDYIKHTMTQCSAFEINNYPEYAKENFEPIIFKGLKIGLTICYDCNHSVFSRMYGLKNADIIINSTGGNVVYDKWYKYNKVRAIENGCFVFVTMGGDGQKKNPNNYVYGFSPNGKELSPLLLNGEDASKRNVCGGIYVYDTASDDGQTEIDPSADQMKSVNKNIDFYIESRNVDSLIMKGEKIKDNLFLIKEHNVNIILCVINTDDIMKPEVVLKLLYANELKKYENKRYIIVNRWEWINEDFYNTKLSVVLKVRSMENYCAVVLSSKNINSCFQCGMNRTAQLIQEVNERFGLDLRRTGGPETIWRNKNGMKAVWRTGMETLINMM